MRVIVTGGGTGGHIYPALAIADKCREMDPDGEILYVGNDEGIEKDIVPQSRLSAGARRRALAEQVQPLAARAYRRARDQGHL